MFCDSYNQARNKTSTDTDYFDAKAFNDRNTYGYYYKPLVSGEIAQKDGYSSYTNYNNYPLETSNYKELYRLVSNKYTWLASPSSFGNERMCLIDGLHGDLGHEKATDLYGVRPAVSLPASITIQLEDSIYRMEDEYQVVEYIESNGTQYIDTNYNATAYTGISADFQFNDLSLQQRLYGTSSTNNDSTYLSYDFYINGAGDWAYSYNNGSGNWIGTGVAADKDRHIINFNTDSNKKINIYRGNTVESSIQGNASNTSKNTLAIMADKEEGGAKEQVKHYSSLRLYRFKIYENGQIVRDYIPCYKKSSNEIGLYDIINNKFYTNNGTGAFSKGKDIINWSKEYQEVEYIESNGNHYIDTGYKPNPKTGVYAEYKFNDASRNQQRIFGVGEITGTIDNGHFHYTYYINGSGNWAYAYNDNNGNWVNTGLKADINKHLLEFNVDNTRNIKIDKGKIYNSTITTNSATNSSKENMYILSLNYRVGDNSGFNAYAKLYCFKIYENGQLIRDYIPCYRKSDRKTGLYDRMNNAFYSNKNDVEFNLGKELK